MFRTLPEGVSPGGKVRMFRMRLNETRIVQTAPCQPLANIRFAKNKGADKWRFRFFTYICKRLMLILWGGETLRLPPCLFK